MNGAMVVARAAVLEHSRRRVVSFFVVGSVVLAAGLALVARDGAALGPSVTVIAALGVFQLLAVGATLAVSAGNIGQPFATGEALAVLARPVSRAQYALGRLGGSLAVATSVCVLLAVLTQALHLVAGGGLEAVLWAHYLVLAFNLAVVAAVTTLLSTVVAAPVLAAIVSFVVYQAVGTLGTLQSLVVTGRLVGSAAPIVSAAWYATPKLLSSPLQAQEGAFRESQRLVVANTPRLVVWAGVYLALLVFLTVWAVRTKDV